MKGIEKTEVGLEKWRIVSLNNITNEEKIEILNELGHPTVISNGKYKLEMDYFCKDLLKEFDTVNEIFFAIDKDGLFEGDNIAILDIPSEKVKINPCNITKCFKKIEKEDDEEEWLEYNYSKMTFDDKLALLNDLDFDVFKQCNGKLKVVDRQGGNYGGIEFERFSDIDFIADRVEHYFPDYHICFVYDDEINE